VAILHINLLQLSGSLHFVFVQGYSKDGHRCIDALQHIINKHIAGVKAGSCLLISTRAVLDFFPVSSRDAGLTYPISISVLINQVKNCSILD
jgi:hypothetical protein